MQLLHNTANNFPNAKEELNCFKFGLSTILLRLGDFSNGLPLYESRKDVQPIHNQFSNFQIMEWDNCKRESVIITV